MAELDKDEEVNRRLTSLILSNRLLKLTIMPTEQCNFRCLYCYEDFQLRRMSTDVVQSIKKLILLRLEDLSLLEISWFGGEPLLAKKIVIELGKFTSELVHQKPEFQVIGDMTTNGYLLDVATTQALVDVNVNRFQISLDGPRAFHDKTRLKADGGVTFRQIWCNLLALRDSKLEFQITLRVHLLAENLSVMDGFIDELSNHFSSDPRFRLFLKPVAHLGGPNDALIRIMASSSKAEILDRLYNRFRPSAATDVPGGSDPYVCYAARANAFVIRANGHLAKCTVALRDERNDIGELAQDGHLHLYGTRYKPWLRGVETLDRGTLHCPWKDLASYELPPG